MAVAIFIGIIGNSLSANETIDKLIGSSEAETIIMKMATYMSENGALLAILGGLIFSGILASTMSTSDSQLLAASSSMSENLLKGMFKIKMDDKKSMISARIVLVVIAVLSVFIAWNPESSVFRIVSFAWAGFGATFAPVMLLALFWKRSNKYGAIAGLITGGLMVFLWKFVIAKLGGIFAIYELLPAFVVAIIVNVIVSLCTAKPSDDMIAEFDSVNAELKG
jgi:sodium/proline symporter